MQDDVPAIFAKIKKMDIVVNELKVFKGENEEFDEA
jgi:hypothetical protein